MRPWVVSRPGRDQGSQLQVRPDGPRRPALSPLRPRRCRSVRWVELGIAGLAGLVLLWSLYDYGAFLQPSGLVVAITFPVLGLVWVASSARSRVSRACALGRWLLLALGALGALSAAWSIDWATSLQAAGVVFGGAFFLDVGLRLGSSSGERFATLLLLAVVGSILSLLALAGYALEYWRFALRQDGVLLATGTLGYANALAGLLLMTLAATGGLFLEDRTAHAEIGRCPHRLRTALIALATLVQIAALALTRSRAAAGVLAFLLLSALIAWTLRAARRSLGHRLAGIFLLALLLAGLVSTGLLVWREVAPQLTVSGLPPVGADPNDLVPMTSDAFRVKTWAAALEAARERPFVGYGLGNFYDAYVPYKQGAHTAYAHNVFIQHLVETGSVGAILLLAFVATVIAQVVHSLRCPSTDSRMPLLLGALSFVLHNLVDLTWYFPAVFFVFALILGLGGSFPAGRPRTYGPALR